MWTLLSVRGARREPPLEASESTAQAQESATTAAVGRPVDVRVPASVDPPAEASVPSSNGTHLGVPVLRPIENGREPHVSVYLHPGRARVATMAAGQAAEQFDLAGARAYPSLVAAELACDDCAGFLLEVSEPFLDVNGHRRDGAILFVPGLGR